MNKTLLDEVIEHNRSFVDDHRYKQIIIDKKIHKKTVVISCMDARLIELLPGALNMKNSDYVSITTAGAMINDPYDSVMKSLIVALHKFEINEVFIVGHTDCGMNCLKTKDIIGELHPLDDEHSKWLDGFDDYQKNVLHSINIIENHELVPDHIAVHGLLIHSGTDELELIKNGYLF
ncbi:carbonic anhydrase [Chengkuizengella sediminis]|uniref:carbonic anhydrase n=1 Tax=Chengkuizengella sediminis TaxID=1885917 RepID=UPI00138A5D1B|nr:carbonic anhydrase [Chengkuizengella sediminis]NDI36029.1 carbonic anhydrase [Chengkuizengella sediminis]